MAGSTHYSISEADYLAASRLQLWTQLRGPRFRARLPIALVLAALAGVAMARAVGEPLVTAMLAAMIGAVALLLFLGILLVGTLLAMPRRVRRLYGQQKVLRAPGDMLWDDAGVRWTGETANAAIRWEQFHGWSADDSVTLLHQNEMLFNIVPHRVLSPGQRDDLAATLAAHGPPRR